MIASRAEIIAIGDEITGGVRLDTNSQWLSRQLEEIGIPVAFHTTVGDSHSDLMLALETAANRCQILLMTGGLGPTADDLTRHAIATFGQTPLRLNRDELRRIEAMFVRRGRPMPPNNEIQAWFPQGAELIPNPEGTASGIEFRLKQTTPSGDCPDRRIIALPGVPAEMKQMWIDTVQPRLRQWLGIDRTTHHHTIHCFGSGESAIAMMLPDLIERGREPSVGITASAATISLRISTQGTSVEDCQQHMLPTIETIRSALGNLVYGENGELLEQVVVRQLGDRKQKISVFDFGLHGEVFRRLAMVDPEGQVVTHGQVDVRPCDADLASVIDVRHSVAPQELVVAIGPVDRNQERVDQGESEFELVIGNAERQTTQRIGFQGHSAWREQRAVKAVLNAVRLF